jgi:hypothetical protein
VTISGVTAASAEVGIEVEDSQGDVVFVGQVGSNGQGDFQDSFILSSGDLSGTYTVYATAATAGGTASGSTTLQVQQTQQSGSVTAVGSLAGISVPFGTALANLGLPSTVGVTLSDGSTTSVGVTWNGGSPAYDGNAAGDYDFTGTLDLPSGLLNPSNLTAAVTVTVEQQTQQSGSVTAVGSLAGISVPFGTALANVGLPATVGVTLSGGSTTSVGVTWNGGSPAYDGNAAGDYDFTGTLNLPNGVLNPSNLTAAVTVTVEQQSRSVTAVRNRAPVVSGIVPAAGSAGTTVTINGSGFTGATAVAFGSEAAESYQVQSAAEITAVSPPGTAGTTVDVIVTTTSGVSRTTSADQFTYEAPSAAFTDVPQGYWAYQAIEALAAKGIVGGFPGGTFRPDAAVTRAQFVKMLVLALNLKPGQGTTAFTDVPRGSWFAPYVAAAVQAGIVRGLTSTRFGPGATITREQMAVLIARAFKLTKIAPLNYSDAGRIGTWAMQGVEETVAAGYMTGFAGGTFQPLGTTTRAQAVQVLYLALKGKSL